MEIFHSLESLPAANTPSAVAIGNFDGVHQGHQALLGKMLEVARAGNFLPTVLTFHPHPVEVLRPGTHLQRITTTDEKLELLEKFGVKRVLVEPFTKELAKLPAEEFFLKYLREGLKASALHVGFNFRFGAGRLGDTVLLGQLCSSAEIELSVETPFELTGTRVSSSLIRQWLQEGEVSKASQFLSRPYFVKGMVMSGDQRGRKLGFPTANLKYPSEKVLPKNGVYLTRAIWQGRSYLSVTNVGVRPTFTLGQSIPLIETHLLDFSQKLYDETLTLEFNERIRDEKKFDSLDALKVQIANDIEYARGKK